MWLKTDQHPSCVQSEYLSAEQVLDKAKQYISCSMGHHKPVNALKIYHGDCSLGPAQRISSTACHVAPHPTGANMDQFLLLTVLYGAEGQAKSDTQSSSGYNVVNCFPSTSGPLSCLLLNVCMVAALRQCMDCSTWRSSRLSTVWGYNIHVIHTCPYWMTQCCHGRRTLWMTPSVPPAAVSPSVRVKRHWTGLV